MDFTECNARLLATIEMINKRNVKSIRHVSYPIHEGLESAFQICPPLKKKKTTPNPLNISVYFIQREKASTIGMAFQYFLSLICATNKRKRRVRKVIFVLPLEM